MILQPPPNIPLHDVWVAGLILAGIVWLETIVISWLVVRLRPSASHKKDDRESGAHNKRGYLTCLP